MATKVRVKVVGFESANSYVKVYSDGMWKVYRNTVCPAPIESYSNLLGKGELIKDRNENTVYKFKGKSYNVGKTFDYDTSSTNDIRRYSTTEYLLESIIALSHVVNDGDVIHAVTGVPSLHYKNRETVTSDIEENLTGYHEIEVDGEKIGFTIKDVTVTLQPLATFFYCIINEKGISNEEMIKRFTNTKTLVIDIGWGTSDIAVFHSSNLLDFLPLETSMKKAYVNLLSRIKDENKNRNIATATVPLMELERMIRESNTIRVGNEVYACDQLVNEVFRETAEKILREVTSVHTLSDYTTVIFTGGGTTALKEYLVDALIEPATGLLYENIYIFSNGAQMANAKGYYVLGQYIS